MKFATLYPIQIYFSILILFGIRLDWISYILFNIQFSSNYRYIVKRGVTILLFILIFISVEDMYLILKLYNKYYTMVLVNNINDAWY